MFFKFLRKGKADFLDLSKDEAFFKNTIAENDNQVRQWVTSILNILHKHVPEEEFPYTDGRLVYHAFTTLATCGLFEMADKLMAHICPRNYEPNGKGWERDKESAWLNLAIIYIWCGNYEKALEVSKNIKDTKGKERVHELIDEYKKLSETREKVNVVRERDELMRNTSKLTDEDRSMLESDPAVEIFTSYFDSQKSESKVKAEINEYDYKKGLRIIEVVNRYANSGEYEKAEALIPLIKTYHENWYTLRRIALKIAENDIDRAIDFTKKIKENTLKIKTIGMIALLAFDKGQKQKAYVTLEKISLSYRDIQEAYKNRMIEKMIPAGEWPKALEWIDGFNHDNRKYDALMKYAVYTMVKKEPLDADALLAKFNIHTTKISFLGLLIFMKSYLAKDYYVYSWYHFNPNAWMNVRYGDETEEKLKEIFPFMKEA